MDNPHSTKATETPTALLQRYWSRLQSTVWIRKDIQTKLKRFLQYVKGSVDLVYTMGAEISIKVQSWVDAAYAGHPDIEPHSWCHWISLATS